ncbi:MAG: RcpC/CpaB family pilus assembly protein [Acidimicrobiia bacterium]
MAISIRARGWSLPTLDRRRLIGIALAAFAGILVLFLTQPAPRIGVLVAAEDLRPGVPLTSDSVTVRWVSSAEGFVDLDSFDAIENWTLRAPLVAGEPLIPSLLQSPEVSAMPNVIALSLDESHAVLGRIAPGDRVDLYRTSTSGGFDTAPVTELLASRIYVVEARTGETGLDADRVDLLLAVDEDLAAVIAGAARHGEIDLVRVAP